MDGRIRKGKPGDLDRLLEIEAFTFSGDRLSARSFRHYLKSPNAAFRVTEIGGSVAGYILVLFPPRLRTARIYSIAVDADYRNMGIGQALLAEAERVAAQRSYRTLRLEVREDNPKAIALYERSGYLAGKTLRRYYQDGADGLVMRKPLAPNC